MNESWRQPKHQTPAIIDLRPPQKAERRGISAWQDLTALRIIKALGYSVYRFFEILFELFFQIGRSILNTRNSLALKQYLSKTQERVDKGIAREIKAITRPSLQPRSAYFKLFNFFLLLCLLASPFIAYSAFKNLDKIKNSVRNNTSKALASLSSGKSLIANKNFNGAQEAFNSASANFLQAQNALADINKTLLDLVGLVPDSNLRLVAESKHILAAGQLSARLGADLAAAITPLANSTVISFLNRFGALVGSSVEDAQSLANELAAIDVNHLPQQYREQFTRLRAQTTIMGPSLAEASILSKQAAIFLGQQIDKRYLLVFQNNAELRGPGGFMGSFALVDFSRGEIKKLTVPKGGTYDTEAGLTEHIIAPKPLWLLNPLWHLWDANWWPDWPTSAKKIEWFYEKSNGPTVDGVISLTPTVVEKILAIHGPVDMTKDYGVIITAENFWSVTQSFSEQKPSVTKEPKKIISDLITKLLEELPKNMNNAKALALVGAFEQSLDQKQILIYLNDLNLQKSVENFGWDGSIKQTKNDYLMVSSTNIGGQKTDRVIEQTITHHSEILLDGQIIDTLKIARAHPGIKNEKFVGVRNVSWLRVYVPAGAKLISASGFREPDSSYFAAPDSSWKIDPDLELENNAQTDPATNTKVYSENGKTVFANWSMVDPGETAIIEFKYLLPFKLNTKRADDWLSRLQNYFSSVDRYNYSLLVQKQPGAIKTKLVSSCSIAGGWKSVWQYPAQLKVTDSGCSISQDLEKDFFSSVLFYKP